MELENMLKKVSTLSQNTNKGRHYFFQYDDDFPKTRIEELKIDIETDGGQVVIAPSRIDGFARSIDFRKIEPMPSELKQYLLGKITRNLPKSTNLSSMSIDELDFDAVEEGGRNMSFMHLGGIFRKFLNIEQTRRAMEVVNKLFMKPPLMNHEFLNNMRMLERYETSDENEFSTRVLNYLRVVEEASARDIKDALGFLGQKGEAVDKALKYLVDEAFALKKRRIFYITKKAVWSEKFLDGGKKIRFIMPYFDNVAQFRDGDMMVIGAKQKVGKSHIAMNIIKRLSDQGVIPYYISLESGNRFVEVAKHIGLGEGDFKWCIHFKPEDIELEPNAVTIIDWLLPNEYCETDKLYKHFAEQLVKHSGLLIIFVQLKTDGNYFAQNMISMFPALLSKYLYTNEEDGSEGYFLVEYMREPKIKQKSRKVFCKYDWENKTLKEFEQ